jgi:hypothetical protein
VARAIAKKVFLKAFMIISQLRLKLIVDPVTDAQETRVGSRAALLPAAQLRSAAVAAQQLARVRRRQGCRFRGAVSPLGEKTMPALDAKYRLGISIVACPTRGQTPDPRRGDPIRSFRDDSSHAMPGLRKGRRLRGRLRRL